jgi:hypothetical protein
MGCLTGIDNRRDFINVTFIKIKMVDSFTLSG